LLIVGDYEFELGCGLIHGTSRFNRSIGGGDLNARLSQNQERIGTGKDKSVNPWQRKSARAGDLRSSERGAIA
jgi:hypothetical protein